MLTGGKPDANPAPSKPTVKPTQKTVTLANWAVKYQTRQTINPTVKGKKYAVIQEKTVNQSKSKKAYLLGGIMSWGLEQDTVEFGKKTTPAPSKPTEANSYYTFNPEKVKLKVPCSLYGRNDANFIGGASGGVYPTGTVFTIFGMTKSDGGTPRLITQSRFLLTANICYVI